MAAHDPSPPRRATIADSRALGVTGFHVTCLNRACCRTGRVTYDATGLPDATVFTDIYVRCRFACRACRGTVVEVFPDWREYRPKGLGWA